MDPFIKGTMQRSCILNIRWKSILKNLAYCQTCMSDIPVREIVKTLVAGFLAARSLVGLTVE